eukprot:jgi/Chrzof1/15264/UNPLg00659.t1
MPTLNPAMTMLLPNMAAILVRGKDNTAAFQILESYLLLGAGAALEPYGDVIAQSLATAVNTVCNAVVSSFGSGAATASPATAGGQTRQLAVAGRSSGDAGKPRVVNPLASEVSQEGLAAAALADVMLQLHPANVPTLLAGSFRSMAQLVATQQVPTQGMPIKVINIMEGFLEVLARLFLAAPGALPALLDNNADALTRFLDRWLMVASAQFLEELLGVRHMAMLGRFRRRIGAVAFCCVLQHGAVAPSMLGPDRVPKLCALMLKVAVEAREFDADVAHLDGMGFNTDLGEDYVLAKRLEVSKTDAVRQVDIFTTFATTLNALATAAGGESNFMGMLAPQGGERLINNITKLMSGTLQAELAQDSVSQSDDEDGDVELHGLDGSIQQYAL